MGMSASQARLIALTARMNDIEYQGQQINQQRTTLSNQVNALYNQLLEMSVPTPPSTTDYTTVQYSGKSGTTTFSFNSSDVRPAANGEYVVTLGYTDYGNSLSRNKGYASVTSGTENIKGTKYTKADTGITQTTKTVKGFSLDESEGAPQNGETFFKKVATKPNTGNYFVMDESGKGLVLGGAGNVDNEDNLDYYYVPCTDASQWDSNSCIKVNKEKIDINVTVDNAPKITVKSKDLVNLYKIGADGTITKAEEGADYIVDERGNVTISMENFFVANSAGADECSKKTTTGTKIAGYTAMTMQEFKNSFKTEKSMATYDGYCEAIKNFGLKDKAGNAYEPEDFMVYVDNSGNAHFALTFDVYDNDTCVTYDYLSNGSYTKNETFENSKLTFDPSSGRITSIDIPASKDDNGNVLTWTTIELEAKNVTDNNAYQDAFNDYTYEKEMYDKKQQEINAKTSIVQQQDKNLELKLTRLDNERNAVNTEMEAVKKVVSDNIEKSYKTFSG